MSEPRRMTPSPIYRPADPAANGTGPIEPGAGWLAAGERWSIYESFTMIDERRDNRPRRHEASQARAVGRGKLTRHARDRMNLRRISEEDIEAVLTYGRVYHDRQSVFAVIGHKEILAHAGRVDLSRLEGIHVVCTATMNSVITVYRDRDFHRSNFAVTHESLRARRRRARRGRFRRMMFQDW
jgi:hypothetical protein